MSDFRKKFVAMMLSLALLLTLFGCGKDSSENDREKETTLAPEETTATVDTTYEDTTDFSEIAVIESSEIYYCPAEYFVFNEEKGQYLWEGVDSLQKAYTVHLPENAIFYDEGIEGLETVDIFRKDTGARYGVVGGIYVLSDKAPFDRNIHSYMPEGQPEEPLDEGVFRMTPVHTVDMFDEIICESTKIMPDCGDIEYILYKSNTIMNYAYVRLDDTHMLRMTCPDTETLISMIENIYEAE